ncbi:hypothetical protein AMK59_7123 [Oryctes borbonicus]|uniref:Bicaudal D-related protein homolog n=1 Tax=Oryctes borbonicus TaxID=1629725 RepID=A0A0T6AX88_9SCAR|nr:hypothetical protein AMK59_7123 [Oryctes borbonicus]
MHTLEEYIVSMENRSAIDNSSVSEDVWAQLQQKDNDLVLAAELGKALLEKNEELKKQHEAKEEELSKKLESVEQDRHLLKRKLASVESEYELKVLEYQNDIAELRDRLATKDGALKQIERDKSNLLDDLTHQNARLTGQLKQYAVAEAQLRLQVVELNERYQIGKKSTQEHVNSVNALKDELELVSDKKNDLEKRLHMFAAERENLAMALEEATDRIAQLERHARDQELRYQQSIKDYSLLSHEKISIEDRLTVSEQRSLLAEMDISEPSLSQECMSVYRQLRSLCQQLKTHNDDDDSGLHSDCSTASMEETQRQFSTGLLTEVAQELVNLVLDSDVVNLIERMERYRRDIQERDSELQRRSDTIMELTTKVSVCEVELQAALEERDRARNDASHTSLAQDEIVLKAREVRDHAVTRKNKAEVELAKTRVELMQANSQLLEAIQQKVELSQQLEQWQMDMQELLDEQLRTKLTSQEVKMKDNVRRQPVAPPRRRLLGFFQR